jgi:hypothetical protein
VLIYLAVNIAVIRAFRTEFRDEFRPVPHLLIPAAASVVFLFPLWGHPVPGCLHAREPAALHFSRLAPDRRHCRRYPPGATAATYQALGGAVAPNLNTQLEPD